MTLPRVRALVTVLTLVTTLGVVACEKGPMEKAGEKVDKAIDKVTK
jgi:hypothetical protein